MTLAHGWNCAENKGFIRCPTTMVLHMEQRTMRAEKLRAQAKECERLASGTLDVTEREALIGLASDLEHQAEHLEKQQEVGDEVAS